MLRSNSKQAAMEGFAEKEGFKPRMKEWGVMDDC